jgi:hypothetical protein
MDRRLAKSTEGRFQLIQARREAHIEQPIHVRSWQF